MTQRVDPDRRHSAPYLVIPAPERESAPSDLLPPCALPTPTLAAAILDETE